jgi:hypothetical protein
MVAMEELESRIQSLVHPLAMQAVDRVLVQPPLDREQMERQAMPRVRLILVLVDREAMERRQVMVILEVLES